MDGLKIEVDGLKPLLKALRRTETGLQKEMRPAWNRAAQLLVDEAKPLVPRRSGTAAGTLRAASTQKEARVKAGGRKAPYYPWLDFGGRVGRKKSVKRPFKREGRYLYPALRRVRPQIIEAAAKEVRDIARKAGWRA